MSDVIQEQGDLSSANEASLQGGWSERTAAQAGALDNMARLRSLRAARDLEFAAEASMAAIRRSKIA